MIDSVEEGVWVLCGFMRRDEYEIYDELDRLSVTLPSVNIRVPQMLCKHTEWLLFLGLCIYYVAIMCIALAFWCSVVELQSHPRISH